MEKKAWKGDLVGGVISSVMGIPKAIPWGMMVFAPLGPAFVAAGTFAGLVAIIFSNFGAAFARGAPVLNSGPFSITTIMLASAAPVILSHTHSDLSDPATVTLVVELIFFTVFLSGVFQVVFGFARIGTLAKYIPYPVIAGLMNGAGIAIIVSQIRPITGLGKDIALNDFTAVLPHVSIASLCLGAATLLLFSRGDRLARWIPTAFIGRVDSAPQVNRRKSYRIPPAFLGIIGGTVLYYLMNFFGYGNRIGGTIGQVAGGLPTPQHLFDFIGIVLSGGQLGLLADLAAIAMSIAIVNSLRSLIVVMAVDNVTYERSDSNKELIGQGVGNMLSAAFGGISSAVSQSTTIAGYRNGATTPATKVYCALFSLLVLLLLTPLISLLPNVVLAASLVMMGFEALDAWSIKLLRNAFAKHGASGEYLDVIVVLSVTGISVFYGTNEALAIGIVLSVVNFIYRMGKDIIARDYDATKIRSNIVRPVEEITYLETEGVKIRVIELQGALFFGTADNLASNLDAIRNKAGGQIQFIILNFRNVSEIDGSGGNILGQIRKRCKKSGVQVCFCSSGFPDMALRLKAFGIHDLINGVDLHDSVDSALGYAEDKLLDDGFGLKRHQLEKTLAEISVLSVFTGDELAVFSTYMKRAVFADAHSVYRQGDSGEELFFMLRGRARVELIPANSTVAFTICILCSGMMFGEMAIIDGSPRSAGIVAEGELVCVSINRDDLSALFTAHPEIAKKLYHGLTLTLLQRLRTADRAISKLRD
ncbi:MAG: SulP family inorganic anion transporter [Gallionella sp.]|nr:SulP family inorganic anion transporter [Gallionella sp.]